MTNGRNTKIQILNNKINSQNRQGMYLYKLRWNWGRKYGKNKIGWME